LITQTTSKKEIAEMQTIQMQRNIAGRRVSGLQRPTPAAPLPSRSVIVRFKENERDESLTDKAKGVADKARENVQGAANKVADKANVDNAVGRHDEAWARADNAPPPVSELQAQDAEGFLKRAGGKPIYDEGEPKVSPWTAAFTRRREIFAGRIAMVGLSAACFWEYILPSHPNIMQQIGSGLQLAGLNGATAATGASLLSLVLLHDVITSLAPWSPSFSYPNLVDIAKRPQGPPNQTPSNLGGWFGIAELGAFSKANELFNGRLAMLGFAAAVFQQMRLGGVDGPGTIAQVAQFMNVPPEQLYLATPVFFAAWPLFWTVLAFVRGKFGSIDKELEIY